MNKQTLYQIDSKGKIREWSIEVTTEIDLASPGTPSGAANIVVLAGIKDGKMIKTITPIVEGKNIGRANETTPYQQAVSQANSIVDKKLAKGYVRDIDSVKSSKTLGSGVPAPMLAQKYDPNKIQNGSKDLRDLKLENQVVCVQDKLDGNRCLAHLTHDGVKLFTRKGKPFTPLPHIEQQLNATFQQLAQDPKWSDKLKIDDVWLDGELFTSKYSFNRVNGLLKKQSKSLKDQQVLREIKYYIYDIVVPGFGYDERAQQLNYFVSEDVIVVQSTILQATEEMLQLALEEALDRGQEGLMIRQIDMPYQNKRTWQLMKYKVFEDDEFEIIGFKKSITGDTLGSAQLKMKNGKDFFAALACSDEEQQQVWDNKDKYLGKMVTVEYFGISPESEGGKPRFPKVKGLRID